MSRRSKKQRPKKSPDTTADGQDVSRSATRGSVERPHRRRWGVVGIGALLVVMVFAVYGQTLGHKFVNYDDALYVHENPIVTGGLTLGGVVRAYTQREMGLWTPLVTVSRSCSTCSFWIEGRRSSSEQRPAAPCRSHSPVPRPATDDPSLLAQRLCRGTLCHPSASRGVGGMDCGAQGCLERTVLHADALGVCTLCEQAGIDRALRIGGGVLPLV